MQLVGIISLSVASLIGQQATPSTAPATVANATSDDKVICRTADNTGSRLAKSRICMTAAQWRDASRNQADDIDRRLRTTSVVSGN